MKRDYICSWAFLPQKSPAKWQKYLKTDFEFYDQEEQKGGNMNGISKRDPNLYLLR